jgi:AcrR family transcriptional regulator
MQDGSVSAGAPDEEDSRVEERRREILDAAVRCIKRYSVRKVAVEDIAREAGISRRTLYRLYAGRRAIMAAIVFDRLTHLAAGVKAALKTCATFEDSVIVGTIETIRLARADRIFEALVEEDHTLTIDEDPAAADAPIRGLSRSIWLDVFSKARRQGLLRANISEQEAMDWLIEIHRLLDLRDDLDDDAIEAMLRKFVLPSLMSDDARK